MEEKQNTITYGPGTITTTGTLPRGKTYKTDGLGNTIIVDDPDYMNDEGMFKKYRRKATNITPKKKKRKKK